MKYFSSLSACLLMENERKIVDCAVFSFPGLIKCMWIPGADRSKNQDPVILAWICMKEKRLSCLLLTGIIAIIMFSDWLLWLMRIVRRRPSLRAAPTLVTIGLWNSTLRTTVWPPPMYCARLCTRYARCHCGATSRSVVNALLQLHELHGLFYFSHCQ